MELLGEFNEFIEFYSTFEKTRLSLMLDYMTQINDDKYLNSLLNMKPKGEQSESDGLIPDVTTTQSTTFHNNPEQSRTLLWHLLTELTL